MLKSIIISFLGVCSLGMLNAQNIGMFTNSPQAPLHIFNSGQVNTPGGFLVLGNPSEAHIEMDFDRIQAKFGAANLLLKIQPEGGNVNIANGDIFVDYNNGKLGFATANPQAAFHFSSSGQVNSPGGLAVFGNTNEGHLEVDFNIIQSRYNNGGLQLNLQPLSGDLAIGNNFDIFVDNFNDAVGIGTNATGASKLVVKGNGTAQGTAGLLVTNADDEVSMRVDDGGRVGINLSVLPSSALEVNGDIELSSKLQHRTNAGTYMEFSPDTDDITFRANGTEMMHLDGNTKDIALAEDDGTRVGIGDVPVLDAKLEIYAPLFEDPFVISGILADFIVDQNGRVGIGDLTPQSDVQVRCSDNMSIGGVEIENVNGDGSEWRLYVNKENQQENGDLHMMNYDASVGYFAQVSGSYFQTSDERRKDDIKEIDSVLDRVNQLTAKSYFFKHDLKRNRRSLGLMAQEVQPLFPELVDYVPRIDKYAINYTGLSVVAIKAIQELSTEKEALEDRVAALEKMVEALTAAVEDLARVGVEVAEKN